MSQKGKLFKGQDNFAKLLMQIRASLLNTTPSSTVFPSPSPRRDARTPLASPLPPSTNVGTPSRFSVLQDEDFPPLPDPATPATPFQPTPQRPLPLPGRQRQPATPVTASGPKVCRHGNEKAKWQVPIASSKIVVIGDSNLARITSIDGPVNSIEIHSYPGARFLHLNKLVWESPAPQENPSHVFLGVGINSRTNKPDTNSGQIKQLIT